MGSTRIHADLVIVLPSLHAGGTERVTSILANHWAAQGRKLILILTETDNDIFYPINPSILVYHTGLKRWPKCFRSIPMFTSIFSIIKLRYEINKSSTNHVLSFLPGPNILTILATWGLGIRTIISERNDIARRHIPWIWNYLRKLTYPKASKILINFEPNRRLLVRWCDPSKIALLPNPIWFSENRRVSTRNEQTLLAVGRLSSQKAFHLLLSSFSKSRCFDLGWQLKIIGEGEEQRNLEEQISLLRLNEQVTILPTMNNIWPEYQISKYFVMPSHYEGTPNALLEAISSGMIPIVSEGVGDIAEKIKSIEPRLVFPRGSELMLTNIFDMICDRADINYDVNKSARLLVDPYRLERSLPLWTQEVFETGRF